MKCVIVTYTIEVPSDVSDETIEDNIYQAIELGIGLSENMEMTIEEHDEE